MNALSRISIQVKSRLGIHLGPQKTYLLQARMAKLCDQEGYADLEVLARDLEAGNPRALEALAVHMTTNHTFFFRESEHFRLLTGRWESRKEDPLRLWSAAGSSGEEGYSLAIALKEAGFQRFVILVSDVSPKVLRVAAQGIYDTNSLGRVPPAYRIKYFERLPTGDFRVRNSLHGHLRFQQINLLEPVATSQPLDAIFCRNLLIYFEDAEAFVVLSHLAQILKPGGMLFLGQTEGIRRPPGAFQVVGNAVYQKLHP